LEVVDVRLSWSEDGSENVESREKKDAEYSIEEDSVESI
jgi:hypothetical protein